MEISSAHFFLISGRYENQIAFVFVLKYLRQVTCKMHDVCEKISYRVNIECHVSRNVFCQIFMPA